MFHTIDLCDECVERKRGVVDTAARLVDSQVITSGFVEKVNVRSCFFFHKQYFNQPTERYRVVFAPSRILQRSAIQPSASTSRLDASF